jgi:hypothetical protein
LRHFEKFWQYIIVAFTLSIILLYPTSIHFLEKFQQVSFCHLNICVHNISTIFTFLQPFLIFSPIKLVPILRKDLFCLLFSIFVKKEDIFVVWDSYTDVSLWYFYVHMYQNLNWFIPSLFLFFPLVPFLWWFQHVENLYIHSCIGSTANIFTS